MVSDDIRERVVSYLTHQATREAGYLRSLIERERARLLSALKGLSEAQALWKPQPDEWSVKEVLRHVLAAERSIIDVVTSLAAGVTPQGDRETGHQDPDESATLGELVDRLRGERQRLLAFLDSLPPSADLSVTFPHPFFGPLNFKGWVAFQRVHDGDHINQVESIKAEIGFPRTQVESAQMSAVADQVIHTLAERGLTLAVAESCTGGLVGHHLTNVPGSSACFLGGVVAYDNRVKARVLGVDEGILEREGAVSEPVAAAMALGVQRLLNADLALSVTGVAGPSGGTPEKPVGTVFVALADRSERTVAQRFRWQGERQANKERSAQAALELLREHLRGEEAT